MNVLLITDSYPPEIRSASLMMSELARGLARNGHRVSVITSMPKYNLIEGQFPSKELFSRSREDGIQVVRVQTPPLHNVSHLKRGFGQMVLPGIFSLAAFFMGRIDVSIVYSPPLPLGLTAYCLKVLKRADYIFNVQDLFPQNAIDLQALKSLPLIRMFQVLEKFIYRRARYITVHSPGNKACIAGIGIPSEKIKVIHNWVDLSAFKTGEGGSPLRAGVDLRDKFVVLFAGVMSYAQDMDVIIEAARRLKKYSDIVFLLVGEGSQKGRLESRIRKFSLGNIILHPFIPLSDYPALVARADVGLVTLKKSMRTPVVPSKILGYMAAGKPIIGSLNRESEANDIIRESGCGWSEEITGPGEMAQAVLRLYKDAALKAEMGRKGREYVGRHFSLDGSLAAYEQLLQKM
ncbi:MAG: glycosyltransferase family 4 protein [PVC group bacterium]